MADREDKPDFRTHCLEGIRCFNALEFWEAHEAWEQIWLAAESDVEQFLQGLIQVAAAYHHVKRGTLRGAVRLFEAGLRRMEPFAPTFCGIDRAEAEQGARVHREWAIAQVANSSSDALTAPDYPKLTVLDADQMPPFDGW